MKNLQELKAYDAFHLNLALYYGAMDGNKEVVKYILTDLKKDRDSVNDAFGYACSQNQLEIVKYLLSSDELPHKADINADMEKHNLFLLACEGGLETVKFLFPLLKFEDTKSKEYVAKNSVVKACIHGNLEILKYLFLEKEITNYFDVGKELSGWLNDAGSKGHIDVFEYILNLDNYKEKFIKDNDGTLEDIILTCLEEGRFEMVEYLLNHNELKQNINLNRDDDYIFKYICENEGYEVAQYLVVDLNIEKTEEITKFLEAPMYERYRKLFEPRDLKEELKVEINNDNDKKVKKPKL